MNYKQLFEKFKNRENKLRTKNQCMKYLEDLIWEGVPVSPFDPESKVYKCKNRPFYYKCQNTNKYFTVLTGTIFENTKKPLTVWFKLIELVITLRPGISAVSAAKLCKVSYPTAWHMLQKIRTVMGKENGQKLQGIVEADEYVAGGTLKNMHYDKKLAARAKGTYQNKIPVHGMVERGGDAVINIVPNLEADTINAKVIKHLKIGSTLFTDENVGYKKISQFYKHNFVVHSKGKYVDGNVYTNSIESLWAGFTRTLGTYIHQTKKYLQNYANEHVFRYNTRKMNSIDTCIHFLLCTESTKITWRQIRLA